MVTSYRHILLIFVLLLAQGCNDKEKIASQSLVLSLSSSEAVLKVINFEVLDNPYKKSQQQGRYQAHLFSGTGRILQKINFERVDISFDGKQKGAADFYVSLPLIPKAERIEIYELDGSSGHYQLKTDDPLLDWTIPENIRIQKESSK